MRYYRYNYSITHFFLLGFIIAALVLFLYHRIVPAYLVSDDYGYLRIVRDLDFINSFRIFLPPELGGVGKVVYYRPIVEWTIWLDTVVLPMTPLTFHLTTILFHTINASLLGLVALYSFGQKKLAFLASIFFTVFPFHSEAVIYSVGGRDNVLVTMFYLISFLGVIQYVKTREKMWIFATCATYLLGLMSHESAATLPLSILLFFFVHQKIHLKTVYHRYRYFLFSLLLVFGFYFILRSMVLQTANPYSLTGYMNASFTINNAFRLYLGTLIFLIFLRFRAKNIFRFFITKEHIFWFYSILIGILFLPTFYIPTQERHLYLPSFALTLTVCSVIFSIDARFSKKQWMKKPFWIIIAIVLCTSGVFLVYNNERFLRAALTVEKISKEIAAVIKKNEEEKKFYLLNFPDNIDGAYVYRTRMHEAIEYSLGHDITQRLVFTPLTNGTQSKLNIINRKSILLESDQGFVVFLPQKNKEGQNFIKETEFIATQLDAYTFRVDFLEEHFDIKNSNVFLFKNGVVQYKPFSQ